MGVRHWLRLTLCLWAGLALTSVGCQNTGGSSGRFAWLTPWKLGAGAKDPAQSSRLHIAYAKWQEEIGNYVEARSGYETALTHDEDSVEATLGLARLDDLAGRSAEAEQKYQRALDLKPDDPHVLDAVGQYYASKKRWGESVELLTSASRLEPLDKTIQYHLAVALARSGDVSKSVPHFVQAVGEAEAHYNVAYILHEQGQTVAARQYLQRSLQLNPTLTAARELWAEIEPRGSTQIARAEREPYRQVDHTGAAQSESARTRYALHRRSSDVPEPETMHADFARSYGAPQTPYNSVSHESPTLPTRSHQPSAYPDRVPSLDALPEVEEWPYSP